MMRVVRYAFSPRAQPELIAGRAESWFALDFSYTPTARVTAFLTPCTGRFEPLLVDAARGCALSRSMDPL